MRYALLLLITLFHTSLSAPEYLRDLPEEIQTSMSKWAWVSYESPLVAVLPGLFNRSAFDAPHETEVSDEGIAQGYVPHNSWCNLTKQYDIDFSS